MRKRTISKEVVFEGTGLHTGESSKLRVIPSDKGKIMFYKGTHSFPAHYSFVKETKRGVVLGDGSFLVFTAEHLLSALNGMGIESADIVFEKGTEPPALDGSSLLFSEKLLEAGLSETQHESVAITLSHFEYSTHRASFTLKDSPEDIITYYVDFPPPIGKQVYQAPLYNPDFYLKNIAPARTFIFYHEIERVKKMGLAKGGTPDNTIIFTRDGIYKGQLRFKDEPVRHKILDFIGDAALLGKRIKGSIFIKKAGHTEHIEFIRKLEEEHGI